MSGSRILLLLVALLLSALPVLSQSGLVQGDPGLPHYEKVDRARVLVETFPPDARMSYSTGVQRVDLTTADKGFVFNGQMQRAQRIDLFLTHPDFNDSEPIRINFDQLFGRPENQRESNLWVLPENKRLQPRSALVAFRYWVQFNPLVAIPLCLLTLVGFGGTGAWAVHQKRRSARLARLDAYQASADTSDPLVMALIGGWRLVDRLGAGGMATVYKGVPDESLDEKEAVAIKVMQEAISQDPEFRKRFEREVRVCKGLQHRNIVRVDDFGDHEGLLYLAMEFVPGTTLTEKVPKMEGLPPEQAMKYLAPIMDALEYAHEKTVVHRDLKPDNVMVTDTGRVVLMDLGLARSQDVSAVTQTGNAMGTPAYMPPEQITGAPPAPSADQYSLGVMMYEMMTGHRPFVGDDPMAVLFAHIQQSPPAPRQYRPDLPEAVEKVILRTLAKEPAYRFPSVADLRRNLENAVAGRPIDEIPSEALKPPRPAAVSDRGDAAGPAAPPAEHEGTMAFQAPAEDGDGTMQFQSPVD